MRLKKVKDASSKIEKSPYIIKKPTLYQGKWNTCFPKEQPIYIEIGMGKGKFIIENAKRYPQINFIGIEKFDSVIVRAVSKLENEVFLPNLKLIRYDAIDIDLLFSHEIEKIYLNFSDPWPKKRHTNRRLTSPIFLEKYDQIFRHSCNIVMKTDNRELFEYSLVSLSQNGYRFDDVTLDLYKREDEDNVPTEYEERFHSQGFPIYRLDAMKKE